MAERLQMSDAGRSPTTVAGLIIFAAIVWVAGFGLYNAYLHPLRRIPGPKLWAAYKVPYTVRNLQGLLPFKCLEFHKKYGPVVRIAPDELIFTDAKAWNEIYGMLPGRTQNQKDPTAYTPLQPGWESNIILANDNTHARLRRLYAPAFTLKALDEQAEMLMKYANLFITQLKHAAGKSPIQDVWSWYNYATFDFTGDFVFGDPFHCLDRGGQNHFFLKTVSEGVIVGGQMQQLQRYGILTLLKPLIPKSATKVKDDMDKYVQEVVDRRAERGYDPKRTDVFNHLVQNHNPEDQASRPELHENGLTLTVAGSETTATLLAGATYFLCRNPGKLDIVKKEVREAFKSDAEITSKSVNQLQYLIAVLSEALRMFPPSPFPIPRIISAKGGLMVMGEQVPEGTRCSISHHAAYRYPDNFARPNDFVPERWLPDPPCEFRNDHRDVVQPFMVGPRACLGKNLAYAEMRLLMAKMLYHFDFELANPEQDWYGSLKAFMTWKRESLDMKLKPVKP